jgi:hypothetical protein
MTALMIVFFAMQPVQYVFAYKTNQARKVHDWPEFWRWWRPSGVLIVLQFLVVITILQRLEYR